MSTLNRTQTPRWEISEEERRAARRVEREWSLGDLARTLTRAPGIGPEVIRRAGRAALAGVWNDLELGVLLDSERVRQALPGTVRGAAWAPDRPFVDALLPHLDPKADALEIGCGVGRIARQVAPKVATLTCSDVSAPMLREARANLGELTNVSWVRTRGYWLETLPDAGFDVVYAHAVLVFFDPYPAIAMLDSIRRVLREGGVCVLDFHTMDGREWAEEAVLTARRYSHRGTFGARVSRPYTRSQVKAMYEATGFEVVETDEGTVTPTDPHPPTIFVGVATRPRPGSGKKVLEDDAARRGQAAQLLQRPSPGRTDAADRHLERLADVLVAEGRIGAQQAQEHPRP